MCTLVFQNVALFFLSTRDFLSKSSVQEISIRSIVWNRNINHVMLVKYFQVCLTWPALRCQVTSLALSSAIHSHQFELTDQFLSSVLNAWRYGIHNACKKMGKPWFQPYFIFSQNNNSSVSLNFIIPFCCMKHTWMQSTRLTYEIEDRPLENDILSVCGAHWHSVQYHMQSLLHWSIDKNQSVVYTTLHALHNQPTISLILINYNRISSRWQCQLSGNIFFSMTNLSTTTGTYHYKWLAS